ncbi:lactonase family protein [Streptomyces sp. NBC_00237]|uniref:lactonase family protein n=1 Tax=Streptomyces sp. NBC_00237 TaxID=2975687 RepID=UPI002252A23A|nr:lactonase family protein [Streptomyces sp. NBC_00237]MCX5207049.1 lactonase family protein [Streptomyces sp. NBC_00237]
MSSSTASGSEPQETRAFVGSFTSAGGRGVLTAAVDPKTGALTPLGATDAVADPSYLALSADRRLLYAVSETGQGAVAAFDVTDALPRPAGEPVPVGGGSPTHLALAAGHLVAANYGSGSVSVLPLRADGTPGPASCVLSHRGGGPDQDRQEGPHAHQVLPDPSGRWVLSVDLGTDSVRVCVLTPDTGTLVVHAEVALRPGTGPRHLVFHPTGAYAYVVNELTTTVTVCRWEAATGTLTPLSEAPLLPEEPTEGRSYASEGVVAHDGRFLWVANRGHDSISVLELTAGGERAALRTTVPCGGHWPRDLALDPTGTRLYAANERSGDVTWFDVDPRTGVPRRAGSVAAPAASCVVFG